MGAAPRGEGIVTLPGGGAHTMLASGGAGHCM